MNDTVFDCTSSKFELKTGVCYGEYIFRPYLDSCILHKIMPDGTTEKVKWEDGTSFCVSCGEFHKIDPVEYWKDKGIEVVSLGFC